MARLLTCGWETGTTFEGRTGAAGAGFSIDTSVPYEGSSCLKCASSASNQTHHFLVSSVGATGTWHVRFWFRFSAAPAATAGIFGAATTIPPSGQSITLNTSGQLQMKMGGSLIGSASSALAVDTWHLVEASFTVGAGATDGAFLAVNGTTICNTSGQSYTDNFSTGGIGPVCDGAYGAGANLYWDSLKVNDNSGSAENSTPNAGVLILIDPTSDNTAGGFTKPGGGTTSLYTSIDNAPPVGIADSTLVADAEKQIRNPTNTTGYKANLPTYTAAGVSGTVNGIIAVAYVGAPTSTGAKTGSIGTSSNPAQTASSFTNYHSGTNAGTFPTGWKCVYGPYTANPTVTLGNAIVLDLNITGGTASRIALCCGLGLYVEYTASASSDTVGSASGAGAAAGTGVTVAASSGAATGSGAASAQGGGEFGRAGTAAGSGVASGSGQAIAISIGSASGTGTAAASGGGIASGSGSAAGTGQATGQGRAIGVSSGSAAGTGTASGVGRATASSSGAAAGTGQASGTGQATASSAGSAAGTGAASASGGGIASAAGNAAGTGTATAGAVSLNPRAPSAAGVGAAAGSATATASSSGSAAGTGQAAGSALAIAQAAGSAAGVGAASGSGLAINLTTGTASGVGTATGSAVSLGVGVGTATGTGQGSAVGSDGGTGNAGSAAGSGAASGSGQAIVSSTGSAAGTGAAAATGVTIGASVGSAAGTGTAAASGVAINLTTGSASGTGAAAGSGVAVAVSSGAASGVGTAQALGTKIVLTSGAASGVGTASGQAVTIKPATGSAAGTGFAQAFAVVIAPATGTATGGGSASAVGEGGLDFGPNIVGSVTGRIRVSFTRDRSRVGSAAGRARIGSTQPRVRIGSASARTRIGVWQDQGGGMAKTPVDWGEKDPNEVIKYGIDFSPDLADGDSLATVAWTFITQAGLTKASEQVDPTNTSIARVTLSAGTHGLNAKLQVTVTTAAGETIEGIAKLKVRNSA